MRSLIHQTWEVSKVAPIDIRYRLNESAWAFLDIRFGVGKSRRQAVGERDPFPIGRNVAGLEGALIEKRF